jgi:hypothetical protein
MFQSFHATHISELTFSENAFLSVGKNGCHRSCKEYSSESTTKKTTKSTKRNLNTRCVRPYMHACFRV